MNATQIRMKSFVFEFVLKERIMRDKTNEFNILRVRTQGADRARTGRGQPADKRTRPAPNTRRPGWGLAMHSTYN